MADEETPGEPQFNPAQFFEMLRKQASVKAGAIMFGEAQVAYYQTLEKDMGGEAAYNLLAHTTSEILRGIATAAPAILNVMIRASMVTDALKAMSDPDDGKEVPK